MKFHDNFPVSGETREFCYHYVSVTIRIKSEAVKSFDELLSSLGFEPRTTAPASRRHNENELKVIALTFTAAMLLQVIAYLGSMIALLA